MSFEIYGPFNVLEADEQLSEIAPKYQARFWEDVEAREPGLSDAYGCFLFTLLIKGRSTPWYVGCAVDKSFRSACFTSVLRRSYLKALDAYPKATPHIFLIAYRAAGNAYARPKDSQRLDIWLMNTSLVGLSMNRNPALMNPGISRYRKYAAAGLVVQVKDKQTLDQRVFRSALGLS